jgi:hypothetical protein
MKAYYASIGHKPEITNDFQTFPAGEWKIVRFPYGGEFSDEHGMHDRRQPDSYVVQDWLADPRSGLLWPTADGIACVELNIHWAAGDWTNVRDGFVRDPLGVADTTATGHWPNLKLSGVQCVRAMHWLKVDRRTPIAVRAMSSGTDGKMAMAQFKMTILA